MKHKVFPLLMFPSTNNIKIQIVISDPIYITSKSSLLRLLHHRCVLYGFAEIFKYFLVHFSFQTDSPCKPSDFDLNYMLELLP